MTEYRKIFGIEVAVTGNDEHYISQKDGLDHVRQPGIRIQDARGSVTLGALELRALVHLAKNDSKIADMVDALAAAEKEVINSL